MRSSITAILVLLLTSFATAGNTDISSATASAINKDSLLKVVDEKIDLSVSFLQENQNRINSFADGLLLLMLNEHFKLGMDGLFPDYKGKNLYMRLYGKYYKNAEFTFPPDEADDAGGMEGAMAGFSKSLDTAYFRIIISSFCNKLMLPEDFFKLMQKRSAKSDTDLLQMYFMIAEFDRNKCGPPGLALNYKKQMADSILAKISDKKFSVNNKIRSIALLQYGGNTNIKDPAFPLFVSMVTDSQSEDGFWETEDKKSVGPDANATIYGLWALLAMRENLREK